MEDEGSGEQTAIGRTHTENDEERLTKRAWTTEECGRERLQLR